MCEIKSSDQHKILVTFRQKICDKNAAMIDHKDTCKVTVSENVEDAQMFHFWEENFTSNKEIKNYIYFL